MKIEKKSFTMWGVMGCQTIRGEERKTKSREEGRGREKTVK